LNLVRLRRNVKIRVISSTGMLDMTRGKFDGRTEHLIGKFAANSQQLWSRVVEILSAADLALLVYCSDRIRKDSGYLGIENVFSDGGSQNVKIDCQS